MGNTFIRVVAFDCEGVRHTDFYSNERQAIKWAERHGLEIFQTSSVTRYQMEQELRAKGVKP